MEEWMWEELQNQVETHGSQALSFKFNEAKAFGPTELFATNVQYTDGKIEVTLEQ